MSSGKSILFICFCFMAISSLVSSQYLRSQRQSNFRNYGTNTGSTTNAGKASSYPANGLDSISPTSFQPQNPANVPYGNYPINYGGTGRFQNDMNRYGQDYKIGFDSSNQHRYAGGYGNIGGSSWRGFGAGRYPYGARSYPTKTQQGLKY